MNKKEKVIIEFKLEYNDTDWFNHHESPNTRYTKEIDDE